MLRGMLLTALALGIPAIAAGQNDAPIGDFAFVQVSDVHVSPHLARTGAPDAVRGADSIAWICREAAGPQAITPLGITTPTPAFGIATGDLTEYGVIDDTFAVFERTFAALPFPLYVTPGNHDNTWVAMYQTMRQRYGGENYSFDRAGCHFVCISSASPQEPVPTIDGKTRAWLRRDLESIAPGTPVFLALHHPPYGNEFAQAEYATLIDMLRDHNVVLVLYGHGHGVSHRNMDGVDGVMGGSTFGKNAGYAVVSVKEGVLRVAYHYHRAPATKDGADASPSWNVLLEKPIGRSVPRRRLAFRNPLPREVSNDSLDLAEWLVEGDWNAAKSRVRAFVDGVEVETERPNGAAAGRLVTDTLVPGWHLLTVRLQATLEDGHNVEDARSAAFVVGRPGVESRWRTEIPAAIKAGPVVVGEQLIVARTDGTVTALQRASGLAGWTFRTGGEILGTPAWSGELLVFGSGDGKVYALDAAGKNIWTFAAGPAVYGEPVIDRGTVYVGDNGGRLHALELRTGEPRWTYSRADYAIESRPCVWGELVVFGAWDGYLYAVRRSDGELAWKVPGPKSSDGRAARYYAPADCGPVAFGEALLVCDRGYLLGSYDRAGSPTGQLAESVSAIAADASGSSVVCRLTDDRIRKTAVGGEKLWEAVVPAGRFPVVPTCRDGAVTVCSNGGLLSVLDGADGSIRWQYQVTPGYYVMAPVAVDDEGTCYVAGMDGTVTALRAGR